MTILYLTDASAPSRAVLLAIKAQEIDAQIREVNFFLDEHLKPEFIMINPQHTIPTMDDNGFILVNSHAITTYLTQKYGKEDLFYPKDIQKRAMVNHMLFFDEGTAFPLVINIVNYLKRSQNKSVSEEHTKRAIEVYGFFEAFLKDRDWAAGSHVTIADFHLISTITNLNVLTPYSVRDHPNIAAWIKRCESLPYYNENKKGLDNFEKFMKMFMS